MNTNISNTPAIDWQLSLELVSHNSELAKDLLQMLVGDLDRALTYLQDQFRQQNYFEMEHEVHKLHGASCYCGVARLTQTLCEFEKILKKEQFEKIAPFMVTLEEEISLIKEAYKKDFRSNQT